MAIRRLFIYSLVAITLFAGAFGAWSSGYAETPPLEKTNLENLRSFLPATEQSPAYAVDGGLLFRYEEQSWRQVRTPSGVLVSTIAVDNRNAEHLWIGAANDLTVYTSPDAGLSWEAIPLTTEYIGGVTALTHDPVRDFLFAGTDTAGLFRLVPSSGGYGVDVQLLLDSPVAQITATNAEQPFIAVRTAWYVYTSADTGETWSQAPSQLGVPTTIAATQSSEGSIFLGTRRHGLYRTNGEMNWQPVTTIPGYTNHQQYQIQALTSDSVLPNVLYVAVHPASTAITSAPPSQATIYMSLDNGESWQQLYRASGAAIAELYPIGGEVGALVLIPQHDRTPLIVGNMNSASITAATSEAAAVNRPSSPFRGATGLAWMVAALAALALVFAMAADLHASQAGTRPVAAQPVRHRSSFQR
jgi:hypothetical protein